MKKINFNLCDKNITPQPIFRANPNHLPCSSCGSTSRRLGAGKVPGGASLRCGECDRFIKWLTPGEVAKLEARGEQR
jgi:hypothetical protein